MLRTGILIAAATLAASAAALAIPVQFEAHSSPPSRNKPGEAGEPAPAPARPLNLLFIHHSIGDQLLADFAENGAPGTSPNGGGLRRLLTTSGYQVRTATYGSTLGERTDLFDWPAKFQAHLPEILATEDGTHPMPDGKQHDVVMFKSCFPNNRFVGRGSRPGNATGPELTVENAKAALQAVLPEFQKHPTTLFVYLTIPPLAPKTYRERLGKWLLKAFRGETSAEALGRSGALSRELDDWVVSEHGWLNGYPLKNVAVIDYYDMLTDHGASNLLAFPTGDGSDSHPSTVGQRAAAPAVLSALNRAVARAGLAGTTQNTHAMTQN